MSSPPPTYGDMGSVKSRLAKDPDFVEWDARITRTLNQAYNLINNELKKWGIKQPLTSPYDPMIVDINNDWSTGLVMEEVAAPTQQSGQAVELGPIAVYPGGRMNIFIVRAKANLREWIVTNADTAYAVKTGKHY